MNRANRMQNICQTAHTFTVYSSLAYPYNRNTSNSNTIPILTFTKTLTRMLVLNGYLTLRHETNQSIKMIIGCHPATGQKAGLGM